ncbi:MAG: hypothetical protein M3N07_06675 [Pseudomonadota bacterium]|nr:hypothetical protein [Pseudomonadota bacterium]
MSLEDQKDGERRHEPDGAPDSEDPANETLKPESAGADEGTGGKKRRPPGPEIGHALRSVYQRTVEEDVPPEMLDLLGKLG